MSKIQKIIIVGIALLALQFYAMMPNIEGEAFTETGAVENSFRFQTVPEVIPISDYVKVPIFIYHSVRPHIPNESKIQEIYDITPELLEQQLAYLQSHDYTTITLDELVRDITSGTTSPITKPVILTFDDGWENQYKYAFPLLTKYNMTATFYVYTNPIGKKPHFLTWEQLREMDKAGMTIADHTLSHPYFRNMPYDALEKEMAGSKAILEAELHKPVVNFASPFGYTSTTVVNAIRDAGFVTGRTTYRGIYHTKTDLLSLNGILISDSFDDFVKTLNR